MIKHLFIIATLLVSLVGFAQTSNHSMVHDNTNRNYIVYLPENYNPNTTYPLLLVLHGLGDSGLGMLGTGFNTIADEENFIAVYPDALEAIYLGFPAGTAWNSGTPLNPDVDDIGFLSAIIDELSNTHNINQDRIYSTGFSMGGIMSHRLACELSDRIAAIASVAGTLSNTILANCSPSRAVPVMHIHGTADAVVAYDGTPLFGLSSVDQTISNWTSLNACQDSPSPLTLPDSAADGFTVDLTHYTACDNESSVKLYTVNNADHIWLGPSNDIFATAEIWDFLKQYSLNDTGVDPTHIEAALGNNAINLQYSPNPFSNFIQVSISTEQHTTSQISLYNVLGALIYQKTVATDNTSQQWQLNTVNLPSGNYFLHVATPKEKRTINLVKQ